MIGKFVSKLISKHLGFTERRVEQIFQHTLDIKSMLKEENKKLKEENERLKTELDQQKHAERSVDVTSMVAEWLGGKS